MSQQTLIRQLQDCKEYFDRSTRCLTEEDSAYAPVEGHFTAAQQVAHVAQTIDWFFAGAFRPEGFDMGFDKLDADVRKVTSLKKARAWLDRAFDNAVATLGSKSEEELRAPLPEGPIMGGVPRLAIVGSIVDHTAHHRGALTVYSRLCGHEPAMPYMEM